MAACTLTRLLLAMFAFGFAPACGHSPPRSEFMELGVRKAKGDKEVPVGESRQAAQSQLSRTGVGIAMELAEGDGHRQLMLGGGLMLLFFICVFMVQETEEFKPHSQATPKSPAKNLGKSGSAGRLTAQQRQEDEPTWLSHSVDRQEEALRFKEETLRHEEADAWRRQEEAVQREKAVFLQHEEELRARYERMEALHPRPALFIPGPPPVPATTPYLSAADPFAAPPPRSAPLFESAVFAPPLTTQSPTLFERALASPPRTSSPPATSALLAKFGSPPVSARGLRQQEVLSFQAQATTYEQVRRDTDSMAASFAGQAQPRQQSPVMPATSPTLATSYSSGTAAFSSSPLVLATSPSLGEDDMSPEQRVTLQNIMQQTGASREATIRAMKKARAEEETILKELEARRRRASP